MQYKILSHGIAVGYLVWEDSSTRYIHKIRIKDAEKEVTKLDEALDSVYNSLSEAKDRLLSQGLGGEAAIFEAHMLILKDPEVISSVKKQIYEDNINAAYLYKTKMTNLADKLRNTTNEYMRERASDLMDIAGQVLVRLIDKTDPDEKSDQNDVILAAREVTPLLISRWHPSQIKGFITEIGGNTTHAAVLARALNIPAISGVKLDIKSNGAKVAIDTFNMNLIVNPEVHELADFQERYNQWQARLAAEQTDSFGEACTTDGHKVLILGNVGNITTAESALQSGAEGIGLLRTEFIYMNNRFCPTEDAQTAALKEIFALFGANPITVRTLDAGGDKDVSWLPDVTTRGVRLYFEHKAFVITQLKAMLRAGVGYELRIMIPMVCVPEEVKFAKELLQEARDELAAENTPHKWPVPLGIMIETPSAVFMADELASLADFFSIGTNDLSAYMMMTERDKQNEQESLQPAVLRAVKRVLDVANARNIEISVCGEMAGDPAAAKLLIGMGVNILSMNAGCISSVKRAIRNTNLDTIKNVAENALTAATLADVKNIIAEI